MQSQVSAQRKEAASKFIMTGCAHASAGERDYMIDWITQENNITRYRAQRRTCRDRLSPISIVE
eukprot:6172174-Lingulodinium_polyedra.AAC.1